MGIVAGEQKRKSWSLKRARPWCDLLVGASPGVQERPWTDQVKKESRDGDQQSALSKAVVTDGWRIWIGLANEWLDDDRE